MIPFTADQVPSQQGRTIMRANDLSVHPESVPSVTVPSVTAESPRHTAAASDPEQAVICGTFP